MAAPPPKPLLVFDGDCNFCALWIRRGRQLTGDAVDYLPSQAARVAAQFPEIPRARFDTAVQLIDADGAVYAGAEAVFRALAKNPKRKAWLRLYQSKPVFAGATEWAYRLVATHRMFFSRLTRWGWGRHVEAPDHRITRWIFLRALGLIYLVAFISLGMQVTGLIGHHGILPADQFMSGLAQQCDARGIGADRFRLAPTLGWFDASDGFLQFQCVAGMALAVVLVIGIAPAPCLALLWLIYLSLVTVGQDFYAFQWDNLLLEAGFFSIFLAPLSWRPRAASARLPARAIVWLLRLLLFKLMFSSGCVKLASGDPSWRDLTALTYHYQTQPLPTWIAWYAHQLPLWFQKLSCLGALGIELAAPFLIFAPRRLRFIGGAAIALLQMLILLTGNYTFFNFLTLALCLLLLDDFIWQKILPRRLADLFSPKSGSSAGVRFRCWPRFVTVPITVAFAVVSLSQVASIFGPRFGLWLPAAAYQGAFGQFRTINGYGLFAVMTTNRHEIMVEGSADGAHWRAYEFKYKPGDVNRRPVFIEPLQPRLDWQMWFAALGDYRQNPWFVSFCERLLQGSPDVLALLAKNPFPDHPPRFIRAELYDYRFTNFAERHQTGAWWQRKLVGEYLPPVTLADFSEPKTGD